MHTVVFVHMNIFNYAILTMRYNNNFFLPFSYNYAKQ